MDLKKPEERGEQYGDGKGRPQQEDSSPLRNCLGGDVHLQNSVHRLSAFDRCAFEFGDGCFCYVCFIGNLMGLDEHGEQADHDCGAKAREEECTLNLAKVEHGNHSRTKSSQKKTAAQNGTANATKTARYRLTRRAERTMRHHARTIRRLIHFIKSCIKAIELTSPVKV